MALDGLPDSLEQPMSDRTDSTDTESIDESDGIDGSENDESEKSLIRAGRDFEQEFRLDTDAAGAFLEKLGKQLQDGDRLTISTDEWELPFEFGEPVELEVDFGGVGEPVLEIEVEIPGRSRDEAPDVS